MDALVSGIGSGPDAGNAPLSHELDGRDLERLRVAGAGARLATGVGSVAMTLEVLLVLDVVVKNPRGLGLFDPRSGTAFLSNAISVIVCVASVALLWSFGRSVSAYLAGSDGALARAFRQLRFFFVLWTWWLAITGVLQLVALWQLF